MIPAYKPGFVEPGGTWPTRRHRQRPFQAAWGQPHTTSALGPVGFGGAETEAG